MGTVPRLQGRVWGGAQCRAPGLGVTCRQHSPALRVKEPARGRAAAPHTSTAPTWHRLPRHGGQHTSCSHGGPGGPQHTCRGTGGAAQHERRAGIQRELRGSSSWLSSFWCRLQRCSQQDGLSHLISLCVPAVLSARPAEQPRPTRGVSPAAALKALMHPRGGSPPTPPLPLAQGPTPLPPASSAH